MLTPEERQANLVKHQQEIIESQKKREEILGRIAQIEEAPLYKLGASSDGKALKYCDLNQFYDLADEWDELSRKLAFIEHGIKIREIVLIENEREREVAWKNLRCEKNERGLKKKNTTLFEGAKEILEEMKDKIKDNNNRVSDIGTILSHANPEERAVLIEDFIKKEEKESGVQIQEEQRKTLYDFINGKISTTEATKQIKNENSLALSNVGIFSSRRKEEQDIDVLKEVMQQRS